MGLKIVTGGTTGAADGTLVSPSNKIAFLAIDVAVNAHIRVDDDTYTIDQVISVPSDGGIEISFDGGSTWKAFADFPIYTTTGEGTAGVDVGDLNLPIKLRQHATTATVSGQFTSDGTFSACTALADVTGFTVTPGDAQNALAWSAVTNRTRYQVDRATNSGFTTGVTLGVYTGTGTSFTDTGLTNGTTYYYRIKAVGTLRYKDSASFATANGAPIAPFTTVTIGSDYVTVLNDEGAYGICSDGTNTWAVFRGTGSVAKITPSGTITVYVIDNTAGFFNICYGPDGNLWVTDYGLDKIRKISTAGSLLASYSATASSGVFGICTDGTYLYFSENLTLKISRIDTSGNITQRTTVAGAPSHLCIGPDGNVWCSLANHKVAKYVAAGGAVTEYALTGSATPNGICSDGSKLWVSCTGTSKIAQMSTAGVETILSGTVADARYLAADPSGNVWYTQYTANKVGVVTAAGSFLTAQAIAHGTGPLGIVFVGGKAWFCVNYPGGSHKGYIGTATVS